MYYYKMSVKNEIDELECSEEAGFKYNGLDVLVLSGHGGAPLLYNIYFNRAANFFSYVMHHTGLTLRGDNSWINVPIANGDKYAYKDDNIL